MGYSKETERQNKALESILRGGTSRKELWSDIMIKAKIKMVRPLKVI